MPIHKESIFRYILFCFAVAACGLLVSWNKMENENRRLSLASTAEASLDAQDLPPQTLPISDSEAAKPQ